MNPHCYFEAAYLFDEPILRAGVQAELDAAFKEAELAKQSLKKYEEEHKNEELEGDSSSKFPTRNPL